MFEIEFIAYQKKTVNFNWITFGLDPSSVKQNRAKKKKIYGNNFSICDF